MIETLTETGAPGPDDVDPVSDVRVLALADSDSYLKWVCRTCDRLATDVPDLGVGVALVPGSFSELRRPGVVYRPVRGPGVDVDLWAVWRRGDASPVRERFLAMLRAAAGARSGSRSAF